MIFNYKRILIIILIVLALFSMLIYGYITLMKKAVEGWNDNRGERVLTTTLDDKFIVKYITRSFPEHQTDIIVMDMHRKNKLISYMTPLGFINPEIITVLDLQNCRCYQIDDFFIYSVDRKKFKGIYIDSIKEQTAKGNHDLIIISKALVAKGEWKWIQVCSSFLIGIGDSDSKELLERYAAGKFTKEEIVKNKDSGITKEEMAIFSKRVLGQPHKSYICIVDLSLLNSLAPDDSDGRAYCLRVAYLTRYIPLLDCLIAGSKRHFVFCIHFSC